MLECSLNLYFSRVARMIHVYVRETAIFNTPTTLPNSSLMKLHLPQSLRGALLACFASVAGLTSTIATGAMLGGAFYVSLSQVAQAGDVPVTAGATWSNADAATHADDTVTVGDAAKDDAIILQVGNGGTNALKANDSIDFGTVTVNAKDTLKLHIWTGTHQDAGATGKVTVNSAITLNEGAELFIEDGSYALSDTVTVNGAAGIRSKWGKGINISSLVGDEHAVLTLSHGLSSDKEQYDRSRAAFELSGDNSGFKGTVQLLDDNGENQNPGVANGVQLILSNTNAMVNAILDFGETEDVVLSLNASKVLLKAIKGHGLVEYYKSDATVGEIELTAADGTFSGTSNANVNWTITGGKQVLSNASILGTYTVGEDADSAFEGAITLGALVNNSSTGIDVSGMTSLTINNQDAFQGATISLGLLTGLSSGNTFTYGDGWLATYDSDAGTATLSDNSAIYWVDAGGADDTDNDWASGANWQGGAVPSAADTVRLGADAANKIIAFAADASIGQARVVEGDYVFTTDGNVTLTGNVSVVPTGASLSKAGAGTLTLTSVTANALDVAEGSLIVNSLRLYSGEAFTKTGRGDLTLTDATANTLDVSAGELAVNSVSLVSGNTFTKTGTGPMTLSHADGLLGKNITVEAGELHITQTGNFAVTNGSATTVTVKSGAALEDDRRLGVTGGSLTVTGGGIYELEGICLSSAGNTKTTLNVEADTVLHITGTKLSATGSEGSFMLSNWGAANDINIRGLLVSDVGISDRDGSGTLNIESGGALQLNAGMSRINYDKKDTTINIKSGAVLIVNDDATSNTDYITTNLAAGATVFTTKGATILNAMNYNGAVELGAAADTILSLTADTPNVGTITILGSGDTVTTFADDAVSQTAAGGTVKYTHAVSGTAITLNEGAKFEAAAGLNLSGALTLAAHSEAKLSGAVTLGSLANAGTINVSELQSLRLGADAGSMGASVNLGTVRSYTAGNSFTYGNGWTATWQDNGTAIITADAAVAWADTGAEGDTDINWATAANWSGSAAPTATDYVQLASTAGVTRTIALTGDTTVAGLRVYDAYTLSVAAETTASFAATHGIELNGDAAALSKAGAGTLSMSSAQAIAAKMHITEGTLKLTDALSSAALNNVTAVDLSRITGGDSAILSVAAGGNASVAGASANNSNQGPTVSAVSMGDAYTGALEITAGKLALSKSQLNNVSGIRLNGGGLLVSTQGAAFAAQELSCNIHIGVNGGYMDHYGASTAKEDNWSSKHTGAMSGSGALNLIGYGEWMFAGTYTDFNGSINFGSQAQRVYLSADMTGLTGLLSTATEVVVGYKSAENSAVAVAVSGKETLSSSRTIYFANGSTFTHSGGVDVAAGMTLSLRRYTAGQTDTFNALNVELAASAGETAAAIWDVGAGIEANLTSTSAYTATGGTIAIADDATVNDKRALTIDGVYTISGAGAYNQQGSLALTANGALTLSGAVSIESLAGNNAGTITFADDLTSLELKDFTMGADYHIGTVTNGADVAWGALMGYSSNYAFTYADGILSSTALGGIYWASPADDDITWGGTNWKTDNGAGFISITAADDVTLAAIDTTAETPVSSTIELAANTAVANLIVNDAYTLSIAAGATYSFEAGQYAFGANGSLSKAGTGTLAMSLAQAQAAKMHITEGALKLTDEFSHTLNQNTSGRIHYDLTGITAGADGVLQVDLYGTWNGTGLDATALKLDATFQGTLEVVDGQLLVKYGGSATDGQSDFGGASAIRLNKGALFFYANSELNVASLQIASGHGYITNRSNLSTISSALSGSGNLTVQADGAAKTIKLTGAVDLDGLLTNASGTLTLESTTKALFDGGITMSGGTININSDADISELSVTGGTFKINGANVGVSTLKSGAITLTGESALTATLADAAQVTLTGANTVDATLSVTAGGTASLQGGLILDTLTVNAGGTLALNGAVSLGSLSNSGLLDISGLTSLSVADMVLTAGSQYNVGALTGLGAVDWNTLLGVDSSMIVSYDGSNTLSIAANAANPVLWVGDADSTWNETDANGASTAWEQGDAAYTPTADSAVLLGNAASLGDRNDSVTRTIGISANTTVGTLTVQDAYAFSVAEGASYSFDAGSIVLEQGGSLGKVGAGTLSMSLADAVAAQMTVTEGTLSISDSGLGSADLRALSAAEGGTISVSLTGGVTDGSYRGTVMLADSFAGVLEIRQGSLHYKDSHISADASLLLNGGGFLVATEAEANEAGWMTVTQDIIVGAGGAHITTWGQDTVQRTTKLTGDLSGSGELQKRDYGSVRLAGTMANFSGSLNVAGGRLYVENTDGDVALSALKLGGGRLIVNNGAALNATTTATTNGTSYATAESGSTLNLGAVTIANETTLNISGAGTHTATNLNMTNGTTALTLGENTALTVTSWEAETNDDTETVSFTLAAGASLDFSDANKHRHVNQSITVSLADNAKVTDAGVMQLSGGGLSVTGTGVYELAGLHLSGAGSGKTTTFSIGSGATVHITGTVNNDQSEAGAFFTHNWGVSEDAPNTITIDGTLILESGISSADGYSTTEVNSGGKLAFNQGFTSDVRKSSGRDTITVNGGGVLEVSTTNTGGANGVAVNIENNAIVMGGNANETTESKIENNLVFNGGAYIGAKAGTTLTIAPADNETGLNWLDIIGTADTQGQAQGAGGKVVFASAVTSAWNVNVLAGAEADFQGLLTINGDASDQGLHNAGTLTLNGAAIAGVFENTSAATLKGAVSLGSLSNSGSIDLAAATSLTLGDFSLTEGATYTVGTLTGLSDTHSIGSLLGAGVGHTVTYDGTSTIRVDSHLVWNGAEDNFVWNAENTNWQFDAAESAFREDQKVIFAALDGVNSTVELGADVTADSILLTGAYSFSVAAGSSYSLAATHGMAKEGSGSFAKVGGGTLIMSNADALAAGVHISAGALQLRDTQANTVNSGSILPGATNTDTWRESGVVVDLSALTAGADGTLQLTLAGQVATGNDSTRLQLAESFAGKVEVLGGQLGHASSLGGATQVILNGGGIVFNNDGDDANNNSTVFATPVHVASGSTGALRAWGAYANLAAAVSSLTGDETATLQKYDDGAIRLDEISGFAGKVEIHKGALILNDTTGSATLNSLYMVAGTKLVLEAGQQLTINSLVEGTHIDMNGASQLGINALNNNGMLDFEGDAAASASFAVAQDETYTLAHDGLTLGTLTNAGAGTLKLKGAVSLGDLYNESGILDLAEVTALSISNLQYAIGAEYHVGQFTGKDTDAFLSLIGNGGNRFLSASYDAATGLVSFNASTYWKDDGADGNNVWADASNWSSGETEGFTLANTTVKLGAEAQGRNILLQSNVDATTTVHVAEAYTFSVAAGESYAFNGTLQYANDQVQALTKAGEGTLTVNLAQATANGGMHIEEGRLVVLGDVAEASTDGKKVVGGYTANGPHDLSAISAESTGILSVALYGNVANNTFDCSALTLGDDFAGILEVTHGYLLIHYNNNIRSTLGGTSEIRLDGGGVALYGEDSLDTMIEVGTQGGWLLGRAAGNEYSGEVTGAGNLTLVVTNNDVDDLTFSGSITLGDYTVQDENGAATTAKSNLVKKGGSVAYITGADNNINISGGVIAEAGRLVFRNQQTLHSLAVNGNSTVTLEKNAAIGSLTLINGTLVIGTDAAAAEVNFTDTAARTGNNNTTRKVTLKSDSAVTDAAYWQLTGGSLTLEGAGTYTIAGMGLSAGSAQATTLNVEQGVRLHVTGTVNDAGKNTGAFSLAHWNNQNTVNVRGVLELESGISTYSGYTSQAAINVEEGGKLAFNNGLTAAGKDNAVTINVARGATLQVSGTDTSGTNLVNVHIARDAIIMGGAKDATLANDLTIDQGFYVGATAGTTLTLAPESGTLDADCTWIDVLGTAGDAGGTVVFDVDSLRLNALNVYEGGKAVITSDADLHDGNGYGAVIANGTLSFDGAGTITLNEAIELGGTGTVEFLNTDSTKLALSDSLLTENNPGLSMTWTLINVAEGGTLIGWTKDTLDYHHFLLNGEELSLGDWDGYTLDNGKLTLHMMVRYWDATAEGAIWNTTDANWRPTESSADTNLFETNSRVIFTDTDDAGITLQKAVAVADAGVHAKSIVINGSGYSFSGGAVLVDQSIAATQDAVFNDSVVIGSATRELQIDVSEGATLSVGTLETLSEVKNGVSVYLQTGGSFRKTGAGTLSITADVQGIVNSAVVADGSLQLADAASLSVGSNSITGGSLQNVGLYAAGSVVDFTGGQAVNTTNVISSADGVNMGVLTDVNLDAGSASAYASIQNVAFAGESTLSGYITFEKTKHQREMAVATGGTLTVENLTFDLHGLSTGTKVLIENGEVADAADAYKGSISGWESITLTYSGVAVNADSVDKTVAGVVTIREDGGDLYWDGLSDGEAAANWNTSSANWSATEGTDGSSVYYALSDTYFGATPDGAAKEINVAQDMVANRIYITEGGYSFAGYRVATLSDMELSHTSGAVAFNNELVVQGALTATNASELSFGGTTTVAKDATLNTKSLSVTGDMSVYGNLAINSGSSEAGGAGSFTLGTGVTLSAANISLHVDAGAATDTDFSESKVTAAGNISTAGALSITGTAAKDFTGAVRADSISVDTGSSNAVSFKSVMANTMTVAEGSTVYMVSGGNTGIGSIKLGGSLGFMTTASTYSNYNVESISDNAFATFGSITILNVSRLSGAEIGTDDAGNTIYGSMRFDDGYREVNISRLEHVQNLHFGSAEYGAKLHNATGAIHGNLFVAAGAGLTVYSDNIMANGRGTWEIHGPLKLGATTQTLVGNTLLLSGAAISGQETAAGLVHTADAQMKYAGINSISANMNVAEGTTLTIVSGMSTLDTLDISGKLSGSGAIHMTGNGTVVLSGANDYSGEMLVEGLVTLQVANTQALSHATLHLEADGVLYANVAALGAPAEVGVLDLVASGPVTLEAETRTAGFLQLHALAATDAASAADAAYKVGEMSVTNAQTLDLLLSFDPGESLQTMKTYNLFTADESYSLSEIAEALNMELYVAFGNSREHVARNQYKVLYDETTNVISIRTMLGNIWSGGADADGDDLAGEGIWSTTNTDKNWSNKDYNESTGFNSAIFVDLAGHDEKLTTVTIQGTVTPGDIYFEADKTYYSLTATDGTLADGTNIHKAGAAMVYLSLANNGTMENAVGNVDLQAGTITLSKDLAVGGEVIVAQDAHLRAFATAGGKLITAGYTAAGDFSGVTLGQDTISGLSDAKGLIASTDAFTQVAIVGGADAPVLLENVTLASYGAADKLTNVAIGENVDVTGYYTLAGHVHFRDTLANTGTVNLDSAMTAEIGKLAYTFTVNDATGASEYVYQLVQGGQINGMGDLTVDDIFINGVNLSVGLAEGVATVFTGNDGSLRLSIGNVTATDENGRVTAVDGTVGMPKWDERWNNGNQPGLSRRYAGTDANAVVTFAEGKTDDADHYYYSSVVNTDNANAVNGEQHEIVVTLSAAATGAIAAGGATAGEASMEMWMYDRSGFDTVIAGRYSEALTNAYRQGGDTHLLINTDARHTNLKTWVVGGSWLAGQDGASYVTVQTGNILNLVGATYGANQEGASTVYIDGGRIYEVFAGGYNGDVASVNLTITGGELGGQTPEGTPDALAGTKSVYGGSYCGTVYGDVNVTVDGTATITNLVGGGYAGTVEGAITLNLMNGTATTVNAAGIGNATARGNVLVNLYDAFEATSIYGGKQNGSGATVQGSSTLAFVEEGVSYDVTDTLIQGFDTISLASDAHVKVSFANGFAKDTATGELFVSGPGTLEAVGGKNEEGLVRNITLTDGATLWFNADYVGISLSAVNNRPTLKATAGTTIDVSGRPTEEGGSGICVWLDLAGHGVDGKGALYKGLQGSATIRNGKVALPRVTLSDSASVNAEDNLYFIESGNGESELFLNGHTLTKIGDNNLEIYNSTVKDNTNANAVVDGTIFVKEGTLGIGYNLRAAKTNIVLAEGTLLDILETSSTQADIGALSGSGAAVLAHGLTITTNRAGSYGVGADFLDSTEKYNQFTADAGFGYAVYSGSMSGIGSLNVKGDGTQYLSGHASSYAGGTHLYDSATLYLMGSTEGSATKGSTTVTGGVVGTGAIAWESANATLYLGDGVQVFNNGTTNVSGATMVIGVEAAPKGDKLTNYVGANSLGADGNLVYISIDGVEYVEVATHNLSSISCNGIYADGSIYMADTLIDRNKMLLVSKAVWDADTATVSGFSEGGYNTATYSGVLSGNANLAKVGQGTLILDQTNTYTGTTTIEEGTLVLKGWAQIGGSKTSAALDVQQKTGSSLMLAYDGTYGDEITQITNDISINGTGDVRWITETTTGHDTAALISTIGSGVSFALRGNISGDGNVLHAGAGTLVLSGDSTYTGGTHATTGVVEVQSAAGLGSGKVVIDATADLHATVEAGTTASRLTTAIKADGSSIKGDVLINGTAATERVLSMNTNGYDSSSTTLNDTGTLLVNGAAVQAKTALLKGTGTLAVSDASGQGATAQADALMDFTGDFVVEGNNAKIEAKQGNFNGGSMSISGQNAKVSLAGTANIAYGEKLELVSTGSAASADDNTAAALSAAGVSVAAGGTLSVSNSATVYSYNLAGLQQAASAAVAEMLDSGVAGTNLAMGTHATTDYTYHFDSSRALNAQTAGMVEGGLTLNSDSRYEEHQANISLAGGALTLNTTGGKIALDLLTNGNVQTFDDGFTSQIVLFSGVSSLTLDGTPYGEANAIMMMAAADGEAAVASNTIYSTLASNYFTGWNITDSTYLVYDVGAGVVYLDKAVPEPTTTTLSILALAALVARRRRR